MSTQRVSVREARQGLRQLLDQVQAGDEVVVLRQGVEVARIVAPKRKTTLLPDLKSLRTSIKLRGTTLSQEVQDGRRYGPY